jgi:allophycocyanin-B
MPQSGLAAMSVVRDLIIQADDQLRYPTGGELRSIVEFLSGGNARLSVVRVLSDNEKKIVDEAAKQLFSRKPEYVAPGGNAYGQKQRAQCLRDFSWYLRLVTYGVLAGSTERIQDIGLIGAREMYNSLGVPMPGRVESRVASCSSMAVAISPTGRTMARSALRTPTPSTSQISSKNSRSTSLRKPTNRGTMLPRVGLPSRNSSVWSVTV